MKRLWQIFLAFFRVGMLGYGGGPSSIPLVHGEVVKKYKWMNDEEFSDVLALGNALPGPIATKMAGYIGYRVSGIKGCLVGVAAMVLPTVLIMIFLLGFLMAYKDSPRVQGMTAAVRPVVAVMLTVLAYSFFKKSWGEQKGAGTVAIAGVTALALFFDTHPALVIGALLILALVTGGKEGTTPPDGEASAGGEERG
ncbi:chromate transporter [Melghirimyces profundicolus]|uniref:Chromate transporter n=1 Tax=Melghirimyces profundicolus TaxID=1242148 RepID=A0A2T6C8N9_9BACL|nr:chromate transporter [Melghirimyces profundicolus]PTX64694.1 chromate transporter [Melghirimyces profundicolus]